MSPQIGFFGGAFDPPHVGHLALAQTALEQLGLKKVVLVPTGQPPHKDKDSVTPAHHRLAMLRLAIDSNPAFTIDPTDLDRPGPHFTVTLLPLLHAAYPSYIHWLLIGGDSLRDLPTWRQPDQVAAAMPMAVLPRPGVHIPWAKLEETLPGLRANVLLLDGPAVALSSTELRRWVSEGRSLRYLVQRTVATYIRQHALYLQPQHQALP